MLVMDWPGSLVDVSVSLSLDEYLALPDDVRAEIVNGALRLMTPTSRLHREVQFQLNMVLRVQMPRALRVQAQELVVFQVTPPTARIPDVVVFRPGHDPAGKANQTFASDVLLCVEVVSRSSKGVDRHEKPAE